MDHIYAASESDPDPDTTVMDSTQPSGLAPYLLDHTFARPPSECPQATTSKGKQVMSSVSIKVSNGNDKKQSSPTKSPTHSGRKTRQSTRQTPLQTDDGQLPTSEEGDDEDSEFVPVAMMASAPNSPEGMRSLLAEHLLSATVMPLVGQHEHETERHCNEEHGGPADTPSPGRHERCSEKDSIQPSVHEECRKGNKQPLSRVGKSLSSPNASKTLKSEHEIESDSDDTKCSSTTNCTSQTVTSQADAREQQQMSAEETVSMEVAETSNCVLSNSTVPSCSGSVSDTQDPQPQDSITDSKDQDLVHPLSESKPVSDKTSCVTGNPDEKQIVNVRTDSDKATSNVSGVQSVIPVSSDTGETERAETERDNAVQEDGDGTKPQFPMKTVITLKRQNVSVSTNSSVHSTSLVQSNYSINYTVCQSVKRHSNKTVDTTQNDASISPTVSSTTVSKKRTAKEAGIDSSQSSSDQAASSPMSSFSPKHAPTQIESSTSVTTDHDSLAGSNTIKSPPPSKRAHIIKVRKTGPNDQQDEFSSYLIPLKDHGWKRELVLRGVYDETAYTGTKGKFPPADVYYFTPAGKKLRSRVMVADYLAEHPEMPLTVDNFSFLKRPISEAPWETVRNAGKQRGRSSEGSITKTGTASSPKKKSTKTKVKIGVGVKKHSNTTDNATSSQNAAPVRPTTFKSSQGTSPLQFSDDEEDFDEDDEDYNPWNGEPLPKWNKRKTFTGRVKKTVKTEPEREVLIESFPEPDIIIDRAEESLYAEEGQASREGSETIEQKTGDEEDKKPHMMMLPGGIKVERMDSDEDVRSNGKDSSDEVGTVYFHPSSPVKRIRTKVNPTARKSTTPRIALKKAKSQKFQDTDGQLCSSACPGLDTVAPSLQCCMCMCLFHHQCVNIEPDKLTDSFKCLRCKDVSGPHGDSDWPMQRVLCIPATAHTKPASAATAPRPTMVYVHAPLQSPAASLSSSTAMPFQPTFVVTRSSLAASPGAPVTSTRTDAISLLRNLTTVRNPVVTLVPSERTGPGTLPQLIRGGVTPPNLMSRHLIMPRFAPPRLLPRLTAAPGVVRSALPASQSQHQPVASTATNSSSTSSAGVSLSSQPQPQPQMMTLPASLLSHLNLSQPLAVKLNNAQVVVPPSCIINSQDGLKSTFSSMKVLLPPSTFPVPPNSNTKLSVTVSNNNIITTASTVATTTTASGKDSLVGSSSSTASSTQDKTTNSAGDSVLKTPPPKCRKSRNRPGLDITQCAIHRLHGGFDCMLAIFQFLGVKDLLRASQVCRTWLQIASQSCLWQKVSLKGLRVLHWDRAADFMHKIRTRSLCLQNMLSGSEVSSVWVTLDLECGLASILRPLSGLHSMQFGLVSPAALYIAADLLTDLQVLRAEHITNYCGERMWTQKSRLDVGKLAKLRKLEELRLRGVSGLALPTFTFGGNLMELDQLKHLHTLSLTSLCGLRDTEFDFLRLMKRLKVLELGDCLKWTSVTYSVLGTLHNLHHLRLECGGEIPDIGVGEAIANLTQLRRLELILFAIPADLGTSIAQLPLLETLVIWPDTSHGIMPAVVNWNALAAVVVPQQLKTLEWGVVSKHSSQSPPHRSQSPPASRQDTIPLLQPGATLNPEAQRYEGDIMEVSVDQFTEKLLLALPKTTAIKVFNTQVVSRDHL